VSVCDDDPQADATSAAATSVASAVDEREGLREAAVATGVRSAAWTSAAVSRSRRQAPRHYSNTCAEPSLPNSRSIRNRRACDVKRYDFSWKVLTAPRNAMDHS